MGLPTLLRAITCRPRLHHSQIFFVSSGGLTTQFRPNSVPLRVLYIFCDVSGLVLSHTARTFGVTAAVAAAARPGFDLVLLTLPLCYNRAQVWLICRRRCVYNPPLAEDPRPTPVLLKLLHLVCLNLQYLVSSVL